MKSHYKESSKLYVHVYNGGLVKYLHKGLDWLFNNCEIFLSVILSEDIYYSVDNYTSYSSLTYKQCNFLSKCLKLKSTWYMGGARVHHSHVWLEHHTCQAQFYLHSESTNHGKSHFYTSLLPFYTPRRVNNSPLLVNIMFLSLLIIFKTITPCQVVPFTCGKISRTH